MKPSKTYRRQCTPLPDVVFGYPIRKKLKKRIAKKYLSRYMRGRFNCLAHIKVGDLVETCSGLNSRILAVTPVYYRARRGRVVIDFELETTGGATCFVFSCGVGLPITGEEALKFRDDHLAEQEARGVKKTAFYLPEVMAIFPDGTYDIDLDAWERARYGPE